MEPGTKIAVISKSGEGVAHAAPSENTSKKAAPKPEMKDEEKIKPKVEASPVPVKPKTPAPPPPKHSATEPQLPPKEKERRVSIFSLSSLCGRAVFLVIYSVSEAVWLEMLP